MQDSLFDQVGQSDMKKATTETHDDEVGVHKGNLNVLEDSLVHGNNISNKENQAGKESKSYGDKRSQELLTAIREKYNYWKKKNLELKGPYLEEEESDEEKIRNRVSLLNEYKNFVDKKVFVDHFDSRSRLHSTVLEEFFVYLFGDLVSDFSTDAHVGQADVFKDLFFSPPNYYEMVERPHATTEEKEHDFTVGINVEASMHSGEKKAGNVEQHNINVPAVVIECKTYVDKTMLEGISRAAESLLDKSPNATYIVASEWIKLTDDFNHQKYDFDQVYVLRKQINTDQKDRYNKDYDKNPIYPEVVIELYERVREHVTSDWEGGAEFAVETGKLMPE